MTYTPFLTDLNMAKKYIDAELLKAEIIRLRKEKPFHDDASFLAYLHGLSKIEDFIDSLQQEQPSEDLDVRKQIEELANDWHHKGFASDADCPLCMQDLMDILWHFYSLGKQAKKGGITMAEEERKLFHQLLDKYLDEPQCIKDVGPRLMVYEKEKVDEAGKTISIMYEMLVRTQIIKKEE